MYYEYTWPQFKNIDYIKKLPLQEQINQYNQYINYLSNQIRLYEIYKNPNLFQSFQSNTAVAGTGGGPNTTTTTALSLNLTFDDIANANLLVGNANDVNDWNTFFDLPTYGNEFTSVEVNGNEIVLIGGSNITLREYLFGDNDPTGTSILEIVDTGCIVSCEDGVFSDYNIGNGCYGLTKIHLPAMTCGGILPYATFADCVALSDLILPFSAYIEIKRDAFNTSGIVSVNFPNVTIIGEYSFSFVISCTSIILPSLITAANNSLNYNPLITSYSFPLLTTIPNNGFQNCTSLTTINLPSCTNLGETVGNNNVFLNIVGNTITLTVPSALMTCNSGNPDGDIQYLQTNNTVTVVTI